jgi:hypothetical protein
MRSNQLASCRRLIGRYRAFAVETAQQKESEIKRVGRLLKRFKAAGLQHFDIFTIAGFRPNEDNLSDAIRALLDPEEGHGLGVQPLICLLQEVRKRHPRKGIAIQSLLDTISPGTKLNVTTRCHRPTAIPDIVIEAPEKFLIFIENKLRAGSETISTRTGALQTKRQAAELQMMAAERNIPKANALGIFMTPQSKAAASREFMPVSVGLVLRALKKAVPKDGDGICASIVAFLDYYYAYD